MASIAIILQLVLVLLTLIRNNPGLPAAQQQQVVQVTNQAVQFVMQATQPQVVNNAGTSTDTGTIAGPGDSCGGNTSNPKTCSPGYHCAPAPGPNPNIPFGDVGGICIADSATNY